MLKAKDFSESNLVYAKDQKEYSPLPVHYSKNGEVTSCWELNDEQIEKIKETKCLWLHVLTFNQPLQPLAMSVDKNDFISIQPDIQTGSQTVDLSDR